VLVADVLRTVYDRRAARTQDERQCQEEVRSSEREPVTVTASTLHWLRATRLDDGTDAKQTRCMEGTFLHLVVTSFTIG